MAGGRLVGVSVCLAALLATRAAAWAEDVPLQEAGTFKPREDRLLDIHAKHLRLSPSFSVQEKYDSNIFLTDGDREEDWILVASPGLAVEARTETFSLDASYTARVLHFNEHDEQDDDEHFANGGFRWKHGRVYLGMDGSFQQTVDPLNIVLAARLEIERDSEIGRAGIDLDPLSVEVHGGRRNFDVHNELFDFIDYDQQEVGLDLAWKVNDHWRILAGANGGWTDYNFDLKNDYEFAEGWVGVHWVPSESLGVRADGGYRVNDYDPASGLLPALTEDYESAIARLTVLWKPCEDGLVTVGYSHGPEESVVSNFITSDRVTLGYEHHLGDRWKVGANGVYQRAEESLEDAPQELKENFGGGATVTFEPVKWLTIDAGYSYSDKRTNDDSGEYVDHQGTIGVSVRF